MLEKEVTLYDFSVGLGYRHTLADRKDGLLLGEIAATLQDKLVGGAGNFDRLTQGRHVADNLLKVQGGHRDNSGKLNRRNLDGVNIEFDKVQVEGRLHLLFAVQDDDTHLGRIATLHEHYERVVVGHGLDEFEQVNHVDTKNILLGALVLVEAVGM